MLDAQSNAPLAARRSAPAARHVRPQVGRAQRHGGGREGTTVRPSATRATTSRSMTCSTIRRPPSSARPTGRRARTRESVYLSAWTMSTPVPARDVRERAWHDETDDCHRIGAECAAPLGGRCHATRLGGRQRAARAARPKIGASAAFAGRAGRRGFAYQARIVHPPYATNASARARDAGGCAPAWAGRSRTCTCATCRARCSRAACRSRRGRRARVLLLARAAAARAPHLRGDDRRVRRDGRRARANLDALGLDARPSSS